MSESLATASDFCALADKFIAEKNYQAAKEVMLMGFDSFRSADFGRALVDCLLKCGETDTEVFDKLTLLFPLDYHFVAARSELALKHGEWDYGLALSGARWFFPLMENSRVTINCPKWDLKSGHDLLVLMQEGVGEQIAFSVFLKNLRPSKVACDPRLHEIFRHSFPQHKYMTAHEIKAHANENTRYVYSLDLGKLGVNIPWNWIVPNQTILNCINQSIPSYWAWKVQVGLAWHSGASPFDRLKTIPKEDLIPLVSDDDLRCVSIQYGDCLQDIEFWKQSGGQVYGVSGLDVANDLESLAALIASLDCVVTCSSMVAHLAGAMGKDCHVILPTPFSLWYWGVDKTSPLYKSVTVHRYPDGVQSALRAIKRLQCQGALLL